MTDRREAALYYASIGLPVFPLAPHTKIPTAGSRGFKDASAHREHAWHWWRVQPYANPAVPTGPASGWLAVDLDGPEGRASWDRLTDRHGQVATLAQRTGGGGLHLVFAYPAGVELGNTAGRLGRGIDTRGQGGYIVVPPSVHPSGRRYEWLWPDGWSDTRQRGNGVPGPCTRRPWHLPREPAPMPGWLLEPLTATPGTMAPPVAIVPATAIPRGLPRHLADRVREAPDRDRSAQTYRFVLAAVEWGLDDGEVVALALAHAPTVAKYAGRAQVEVARILARARPDHPHAGQPCDRAGCHNRPDWMR